MNNKSYVGIDNGVSGAIARIAFSGTWVEPLKVEKQGRDTFVDCRHVYGVLDAIQVENPGGRLFVVIEGAQKFTLGRLALASTWCAYGVLRTVLRLTRGVEFVVVTPQAWQTTMLTSRKANPEDTKAASIRTARLLFPDVSLRRTTRCRTDDHNMADALLMAEWARRQGL